MTYPILKTSIKIGIASALAIILFQVSNIFLVYRYFKFDYYITAIAILFLAAGFFISKYNRPAKPQQATAEDPLLMLTNKELAILQQIAEGKSNKDVANLLNLSVYTVETHRGNILEKLGLHTVPELILYAVRKGVIS